MVRSPLAFLLVGIALGGSAVGFTLWLSLENKNRERDRTALLAHNDLALETGVAVAEALLRGGDGTKDAALRELATSLRVFVNTAESLKSDPDYDIQRAKAIVAHIEQTIPPPPPPSNDGRRRVILPPSN